MASRHEEASEGRSPLAEITRGMVHLHRVHFGKGATRARTEYIGEDGVICVLRDSLTQVELTLIDRGHEREVRALRHAFQNAMEADFRAVIETSLGRPVVAFLSQVSLTPDISAEIFFLEPR